MSEHGKPATLLTYSYGRYADDRRPKAYEATWEQFVAHICESMDTDLFSAPTGNETKDEFAAYKKALPYIAAEFDGSRGNDNVVQRSLIYIDLDGVKSRVFRDTLAKLEDLNISYFAHTTTSDRHPLKDGARCYRILIPTNRPMQAGEIYDVQCKFTNQLGLFDVADITAHQRARIMFCPTPGSRTWSNTGRPVNVRRVLRDDWTPPSESGSTVWTEAALANADENSRAIADWCFDEGLEPLQSGRGWAIACPNAGEHSDGEDGTNGSTAIMLPDATHPEVRFNCMHAHCQEHNRHQHLMLGLVGVPAQYLPEAHNLSKKQIAELLPYLDDSDVDTIYKHETESAAEGLDAHICTDEDLEDAPVNLFTKRDPIIEGLINFRSTWYAAGDSNIGKSFFVMGMMGAVSAGIPFGGQKVIQSHCFYIDAEGGETSEYRKQALQMQYQDNLDWLHIIDIQREGWDITDKKGRKAITRFIKDIARDEPVGLIAFDSLNQTVAMRADDKKPFDENSATDMGEVVKALKHIADETGGSAGVVHHPAKSSSGNRTARGSGALHGAVDYAFFIEQPDDEKPLQLNLYTEKARNSVKQFPRGFLLGRCKIEVKKEHEERIESYLSTKTGPDFSAALDGYTAKPLDVSPRDETLFLIPVALAPFPEKTAALPNKPEKEKSQRSKMHDTILAALEQMEDKREGFSCHDISKQADLMGLSVPSSGGTMGMLDKMVEQKILVNGRDRDGERIRNKYRLPIGINDYRKPEPKARDEDLE